MTETHVEGPWLIEYTINALPSEERPGLATFSIVHVLSPSEPRLEGIAKWDGCLDFRGHVHLCDGDDLALLFGALAWLRFTVTRILDS